MKFALQIYGVFRTFEKCLPDILQYIHFDSNDYDVFILSQRSDGYSIENENRIRQMFKGRILVWKYIEDYPSTYHEKENQLCKEYDQCVDEARQSIQPTFMTNAFVTRLWFRRYLTNELRRDYERLSGVKYDWVIRTRFDIGYLAPRGYGPGLTALLRKPAPNILYAMPDTFSCGCPEVINYESNLIGNWPYVYKNFKQKGALPPEFYSRINPQMVVTHFTEKWLFMSEVNLITYMSHSPYKLVFLPAVLQIIRPQQAHIPAKIVPMTLDKPILSVNYGFEQSMVDLTEKFRRMCERKKFVMRIGNEFSGCDPAPSKLKKFVIVLDNNQKIDIDEGTYMEFTYQV